MSALDDILQGHELIKYMVEDGEIYYSREVVMSAKAEYESLKARIKELEKIIYDAAPFLAIHGFGGWTMEEMK